MKKYRLITAILTLALAATSLWAQDATIQRQVFGSGGGVMSGGSEGYKISGLLGQVAIEERVADGGMYQYFQGFWVPDGDTLVGVEDNSFTMSKELMNYPNPFSSRTTIRYKLPSVAYVTIKIYDMVGRIRATLVDGIRPAGENEIVWFGKDDNGLDLPDGSYVYELTARAAQSSGPASFKNFHLRNVMVIVR